MPLVGRPRARPNARSSAASSDTWHGRSTVSSSIPEPFPLELTCASFGSVQDSGFTMPPPHSEPRSCRFHVSSSATPTTPVSPNATSAGWEKSPHLPTFRRLDKHRSIISAGYLVCMPPSKLPPEFDRGRSVVSLLHAHLVLTPKYRRGVSDAAPLAPTEAVMSEVCADFGVTPVEFNGEDDHVHLLVEYPPTVQLSRLVNSLKGVSARVLRRDHPSLVRKFLWGSHFWSPSYFVGSVGEAPLDVLRTYIEQQRTPTE